MSTAPVGLVTCTEDYRTSLVINVFFRSSVNEMTVEQEWMKTGAPQWFIAQLRNSSTHTPRWPLFPCASEHSPSSQERMRYRSWPGLLPA